MRVIVAAKNTAPDLRADFAAAVVAKAVVVVVVVVVVDTARGGFSHGHGRALSPASPGLQSGGTLCLITTGL